MVSTAFRTVSKVGSLSIGQKFSLQVGGEVYTFSGVEMHGAPANHGAIMREGDHLDDLGFLPVWIKVLVE